MRKTHLAAVLFLLAAAAAAHAGTIDLITLNTSSLSGTTGSIDFQFNPGLAALGATADITGFTGATYISGSQQQTGGASGGPVPAAIVLSNTQADNEDFEDVTFGTSLSFDVSFSGPAVTSPNGAAGDLSTFAFSVFSNLAGTVPASGVKADPSTGNVADITLSPEGVLEPNVISANAQVAAATPEPGSAWLLFGGVALCGGLVFRRGLR